MHPVFFVTERGIGVWRLFQGEPVSNDERGAFIPRFGLPLYFTRQFLFLLHAYAETALVGYLAAWF